MKINTFKNLNGKRDVFEFMQGEFKHEHWHESSIFLTEEAFHFLHLHIDIPELLPDFNYFGPNSVTPEQWNQIALKANILIYSTDVDFLRFFTKIDEWVQKTFEEHTCFSICGP